MYFQQVAKNSAHLTLEFKSVKIEVNFLHGNSRRMRLKRDVVSRVIYFMVFGVYSLCALSPVQAMGRRPAADKKAQPDDFVLPEIEIITKPEASIDLLSKKETQAPAPEGTGLPTTMLPAKGEDAITSNRNYRVIDLQKALKNAGMDVGAIDGKMGPKTKKAIRDFQRTHNLVVDGIVGVKTWERLKPFLTISKTETKN